MKLPEKVPLSGHDKLKLQQLLSHYIKKYEMEYKQANDLSSPMVSQDMAEYLNIGLPRYYEVRGATKPTPKLVTAISYLQSLANLRDMPITDFVSYLLDENPRFDHEGNLKEGLENWEDIILQACDGLNLKTRKRFVAICSKGRRQTSYFESFMSLVADLEELDIDVMDQVTKALKLVKLKYQKDSE
ncbi:MAG: hypothetical protein HRU09_21005 [Oligoflexales bacterium]|nr:hypothetical protein [Oligoflexales bacterium]